MATESLIVELDADTASYNRKLKQSEKVNEQAGVSMLEVGKSAFKMSATIATAAAAAVGALTALVNRTADQRREMEILAKQTKLSANEFQAITFATERAGIPAEQFADISKDIADRLGEFAAAGTGTFQDFADVAGLTKEQAQGLAVEWQNLSSDQVLGNMVTMMEEAGASGNQMTFVMESMGNDASRLTDLFKNNSKELREQKARFDELAAGMQLTSGQARQLEKVNREFEESTKQIGLAVDQIAATAAPLLSAFFSDIISIVPDATQLITDFINSFKTPEEIQTIRGVKGQIESLNEDLADTVGVYEAYTREVKENGKESEKAVFLLNKGAQEHIELLERQAGLKEQLIKLEKEQAAEEVRRFEPREFQGARPTGTAEDSNKELQAILDRFKSEEQLLHDKLKREAELLNQRIPDEKERLAALKSLGEEHQAEMLKLLQERAEAENKFVVKDGEEIRRESLARSLQAQLDAVQKRQEAFQAENETAVEALESRLEREKELIADAEELKLLTSEQAKERLFELENEHRERLSDLGQTDMELLNERIALELELQQQLLDQKIINEEDYLNRVDKINRNSIQKKIKLAQEEAKAKAGLDNFTLKTSIGALDALGKHSEKAAKAAFAVKKAQKLSEAVANTSAGITEALPNIPLAAAVGIAGAAEIATIASTSFGGSGGGSQSVALSQPPEPQSQGIATQATQPTETSTLEITEQGDEGRQEIVIRFATDTGDDFIDTLANSLNDRQRRGA